MLWLLTGICGIYRGHDAVGHDDGFGDMVADVVAADEAVDAGVFE